VNLNIPAPKIGAIQVGLKTPTDDFLDNSFNDIYEILLK
jgi:hypothetical protein